MPLPKSKTTGIAPENCGKLGVIMTDLRNAILATLTYYDVFDYPLTATEVHSYLVNPARVSAEALGVGAISQGAVTRTLDAMSQSGRLTEKNGFYFLSLARLGIYDTRIERQKMAAGKWKKLLRKARWFRAVPYLRGLFVSGSLALDNTGPDSDFDVLAVGQSGRLYTCRAFLSLTASFLGVRRTRHDIAAPDKFCFNHYVGSRALAIGQESIYTAHTYAQLVPILAKGGLPESFYSANLWINKYVYNFRPSKKMLIPQGILSAVLSSMSGFGELVLGTFMGEWLERGLKAWQQKRIKNNPATHETGGRVLFTDDHLEFHPRSFEAVLISRYNEGVKNAGIVPHIPEQDSGLNSTQ